MGRKNKNSDIFWSVVFFALLLLVGFFITPTVRNLPSFAVGFWDGVATLSVLDTIGSLLYEEKENEAKKKLRRRI